MCFAGRRCPTLVVARGPRVVPARALRNVLCAVNFSPWSNGAIDRALSLAAGRECRLTLLHVVPGPEGGSGFRTMRMHVNGYYHHVAGAALQRLQRLIPVSGEATMLARVTIGSVASEILRIARASEADVLVVGTQARSRLGCRSGVYKTAAAGNAMPRTGSSQLPQRSSGNTTRGGRRRERQPAVSPRRSSYAQNQCP